ncbi:PQQ-binding-like beta-propeller repeat protein [Streptomyces sp. CAU 1734]|uniref:outer membrane protein assembly factor BamB family protein n=1 Tax=Streptomyces sp. CAU 1734 TaxID=3140360 RepID=UPI003260F09B
MSLLVLTAGDGGTPGERLRRANALEAVWTFRTQGRALDVSDLPAAVGDRLLAIPQDGTVSVVDTRDGRLLSTPDSPAEEFAPIGFSGGAMFALERGSDGGRSLNAYDPATGRELWDRAESPLAEQGRYGEWLIDRPLLPNPGPVIVATDGRLSGLAPRTGAVRWSERVAGLAPCEPLGSGDAGSSSSPYSMGTTAGRIVLLKSCPGRSAVLEIVDARDGTVIRRKKLGRWRESAALGTVRHAIGVSLDGELRVLTDSGEEILRRKAARKSAQWLAEEAGGVVYLSAAHYGTESDPGSLRSHSLHAVRADTGKTLWTRTRGRLDSSQYPAGEAFAGTADAAGAYSGDLRWSVGDARLQGPGASSLTDLAGRRTPRVPWPVAGTLAGVSGELLIVRSEERDGTRYTALRPVQRAVSAERPAALGGVPRTDWPDACALVGAGFLAQLGRDHVELPVAASRKVLGTELPRPSVCRFAAESGSDDDVFSVTVRWVAPDPEAARTYAASVLPWGCNPWLGACVTAELTEPGRGVHLYTYRTGLEQIPVAHATVVSGRHVLGVSAGSDKARTRRLVERVALHLSRRAGRVVSHGSG